MMTDYERDRRERRRAETLEAFHRWSDFLGLVNYGIGVPAFDRVREAVWAVRDYRQTHNQRVDLSEEARLAVRVVADTLAVQIQSAATGAQDADTVAWVVAGLQCPLQPFCTGCTACQTVTSPLRPCAAPRRGAFS